MKKLFEKHEIMLIVWTATVFLISVLLLVVFGLIPTEFKVNGGETFEQKTRTAVREIIEGKTGATISTDTGAKTTNKKPAPSNAVDTKSQVANNTTNANYSTGNQVAGTQNPPAASNLNSSIRTEDPVSISIPAIGVNGSVLNPKTTSFETLDSALTKGAVRYPGSGYPGLGNMFIFGHSTSFSVVQNQAYKIFNKLNQLKVGDVITISGQSAVYEYRVTSVVKVDKNKALVEFDTTKNMLTLSTCDSFGRAQDRYVVEADFVGLKIK